MGKLTSAGYVGVPGPGERVCGRCLGNGLMSRRVSNYPGYAMCESCDGSGVKPNTQALSSSLRARDGGEGL